jgi:predicted protein tyrosine phosphatase
VDYNKIGDFPLGTNYGVIFQGSAVDATINTLPGPLVIVTMDAGELDESYIDHIRQVAIAELYIGINDSPDAILPPEQLIAHANAVLYYLEHGFNVYLHCAAGVSRASYLDCTIHMIAKGIDFDTALAYIRKFRPQASPNSGFSEQLKHLKF